MGKVYWGNNIFDVGDVVTPSLSNHELAYMNLTIIEIVDGYEMAYKFAEVPSTWFVNQFQLVRHG